MHNLEPFILTMLGAIMTANQADIDAVCDSVSGRIVAAVKDSETKLDDTAADALAQALVRIAGGIDDGLQTVADDQQT